MGKRHRVKREKRQKAWLVEAALAGEQVRFCLDCKVSYVESDRRFEQHGNGWRWTLSCPLHLAKHHRTAHAPESMCRCGHAERLHGTDKLRARATWDFREYSDDEASFACAGAGFEPVNTGTRRAPFGWSGRARKTVPIFKRVANCDCKKFRPLPTRPVRR